MTDSRSQIDGTRLLTVTVALWLGYLLALAVIDLVLYAQPVFGLAFYLVNGLCALYVLGLAVWPAARNSLGRALLPLVIGLLALAPLVTANLAVLDLPASPANSPETVNLRLLPLLLLALILTAWQYGWPKVLIYIGVVALLTLGLQVSHFQPGGAPLLPPLTILLMQTVSFLIVGYFVSLLIRRLQQQQESLRQANAQLADFAAALEDLAVSRERNRLARDLHDTLAHTLSAVAVQLETVRAYWEVDPPAARAMLDKSLTTTRSGLLETRRALKALRSSPLEDLGLALALRQLAGETAEGANLLLRLSLPDHLPVLSPAQEQCIYRVAQEAAANVVQHAQARTLTLQLSVDGATTLRVADDGAGFDVGAPAPAGHFGVEGMRERTRLIGGELIIHSRPGQGTEVLLTIRHEQ